MKNKLKFIFGILFLSVILSGCMEGEEESSESLEEPTTTEVISVDVEQAQKEILDDEERQKQFADSLFYCKNQTCYDYAGISVLLLERDSDDEKILVYSDEDFINAIWNVGKYVKFSINKTELVKEDFDPYLRYATLVRIMIDKSHTKEYQKLERKYKFKAEDKESLETLTELENWSEIWEKMQAILTEEERADIAATMENIFYGGAGFDESMTICRITDFQAFDTSGKSLSITKKNYADVYVESAKKEKEEELLFEKKKLNAEKVDTEFGIPADGKERYVPEDSYGRAGDFFIHVTYYGSKGQQGDYYVGGKPLYFKDNEYDDFDFSCDEYVTFLPADTFVTARQVSKEEYLSAKEGKIGKLSYFNEGEAANLWDFGWDVIINDRGTTVTLVDGEDRKVTMKNGECLVLVPHKGITDVKIYEK